MTLMRYRKADVDGLRVFYREVGRLDAPAMLARGVAAAVLAVQMRFGSGRWPGR